MKESEETKTLPETSGKSQAVLEKAGLIGAVGVLLIAIAPFLPFVSVVIFKASADFSAEAGFTCVILFMAAVSGYALHRRIAAVLASVGTALLVNNIFLRIHMDMGIFHYTWGAYCFVTGSLLVFFAGLLSALRVEGEAVSIGTLLTAWKACLGSRMTIANKSIPGWGLAIAFVVLFCGVCYLMGSVSIKA